MESKATVAFVKALMQVKAVEKTKRNEQFKSPKNPAGSGYSDFASVVETANEALHPNGLAFSQDMTADEFGVAVRTNILHETGEVLLGEWCKFPAAQKTPQGYGSTATYVKRYSLKARMGMVDEDDDGNAGSVTPKTQPAAVTQYAAKTPQTQQEMVTTLRASIDQIEQRRGSAPPVEPIFPAYGRAASTPIRGAKPEDLSFYQNGCKKTLADPGKARFHDKEAKLLAAIEAEMQRQANP